MSMKSFWSVVTVAVFQAPLYYVLWLYFYLQNDHKKKILLIYIHFAAEETKPQRS